MRTISRNDLGVPVPACYEVVYELKCVIAACHQRLKRPDVTDELTKNLREVIQKIERSIELLHATDRDREWPECD